MPPRKQKKVPRKLKTHQNKLPDGQGRGMSEILILITAVNV